MNLKREIEIVLTYLNQLGIKINHDDFKYQIESHPDNSSLLAFSDTMSFFSVSNVAFKIPFSEIESLPVFFLTILSSTENKELQFISFIKLVKGKYFYTDLNGKETEISLKRLGEQWTETVLLVLDERHADSRKKSLSLSPLALVILNIIILSSIGNIHSVILSFLILSGIYLSVEAIKIELGFNSAVSDRFCNATQNSDCGKIINSNKAFFGLSKLTDLSIWFFSSQLMCLYIFSSIDINSFLHLLFISLICLIPVTFYSIFFQLKVEKKWCPVCVGIISVIYLELIYLSLNISMTFNFTDALVNHIFLLLSISSIPAIGYNFLKKQLKKIKKTSDENLTNLRYIKNYHFFKRILLLDERKPNFYYQGLSLGNTEANIKLTVVYSLFCNYCKELHDNIYSIYNNHKDKVNIKVRFHLSGNDERVQEIHIQLHRIYQDEGESEFIKALDSWFENKNIDKWLGHFSKKIINRPKIVNDIIADNYDNQNNDIFFTPYIFVNDYVYPKYISKDYIKNFIPDLIEDKDFIKHPEEELELSKN